MKKSIKKEKQGKQRKKDSVEDAIRETGVPSFPAPAEAERQRERSKRIEQERPEPRIEPAVRQEGQEEQEEQDEERGLVCRFCGCRHFYVIESRPAPKNRVRRRRECRNCGKMKTTYESDSCS